MDKVVKMSTIELKKILIEKITMTNDQLLLEVVYRLLEINADESGKYVLNDEQMSIVEEAREEIKQGKFLNNDEANNEAEEWLK